MITYSEIYEVFRKEKYNEQLQELPSNFVSEVAEYLSDKSQLIAKDSETFSETIQKLKKQVDGANTMIRELMSRRERKIIALAFLAAKTGISKKDVESMLQHEKEFFELISKKICENEITLKGLLNGEKEKSLKNQIVRFKQDVDEFLDVDGNVLGPFKSGDIANLPKEMIAILNGEGKTEIIVQE
jgi:DNA replication initiation complex subunit (GINS family)